MSHELSGGGGERRWVDDLPRADALALMLQSHVEALFAAAAALPQVDEAAGVIADALTRGATLHYAAAGSSALMALADASELPGTFGVLPSQVRICMAGGVPIDAHMPGDTEDDVSEAQAAAAKIAKGDVAIVISASGTTPYALSFAQGARENGAQIIAIANAPDAKLMEGADVAIALCTGAEVVSGSTRLGAATAQKAVLNMMSTQAGILLGHVHDGMMVNLNPDNIKLRKRACDIVSKIAKVNTSAAEDALALAAYDTKLAILLAQGIDMQTATTMLQNAKGRLKDCLPQQENTAVFNSF